MWYSFKSKDRKIQGYCPTRDEEGVAKFADYPIKNLVIKKVIWDGKEFIVEDYQSVPKKD